MTSVGPPLTVYSTLTGAIRKAIHTLGSLPTGATMTSLTGYGTVKTEKLVNAAQTTHRKIAANTVAMPTLVSSLDMHLPFT